MSDSPEVRNEMVSKIEDRNHSVKEVADIFGVTTQTVLLWIRNNKLEAIKLGKSYRISRGAMVRLINKEYS